MKYLSHREIQIAELNILLKFDAFCKKYNLHYSLLSGTLLGAVRHKGFIPWDDDIDVCMARPDFEKLLYIVNSGAKIDDNLELYSYRNKTLEYPFAKVLDLNTNIEINNMNSEEANHIWIDVFQVDGVINSKLYLKINWFIKTVLSSILESKKNIKISNLGKRGILGFIAKRYFVLLYRLRILNPFVISKIIDTLSGIFAYNDANFVADIVWGEGEKAIMKKSDYESFVYVDFENYKFPAMGCWDKFLTDLYGDYNKLPPIEKQVNHDFKAWYIGPYK